ncbi:hypothetical protein PHLGIDRAFT_293970 [Phlebiopsis gigantea 11061_1 CR5-6]|uniref:Uncharacterized protein n=1 Tax=Phlebiopsis gigantea (strain 11061_1 CR5-6) TaxID=745531 RepID=A0A0C3S0F5_PHLG1|nr:hypothetical protein PHLGIDRAFT_293970 [Phlebiopsis gigantea 11061_1 CR5-6]
MKTIPEYWASRKLNRASSLVTCLARDGAWYFMAILAINLMLIFYQINPLFVGVISQLATSLPPILLNRCIINLRSLILSDDSLYPDRSMESDSESDPGLGPPMMSTNLDDIGEDSYDDIVSQERTRRSDVEKNEW